MGVAEYLEQIAPWPSVDRYPIVAGRFLTLDRLSQLMRLATTGYRQQFVDALDELIERDAHAYGIVAKRALSVANGTLSITPAKLEDGAPQSDIEIAKQIADDIGAQIAQIPNLKQHLASLCWAHFYGLQGCEIIWANLGSGIWRVRDLVMIHSRRLSYPRPGVWDLFIWDQGAVYPWGENGFETVNRAMYGLRIDDFPGKFIMHAPQVRGDYPTREGTGRELAFWMLIKHVAARGAPVYLERFSSPVAEAIYHTDDGKGKPKIASEKDVNAAEQAIKGILRSFGHPDSVEYKLHGADGQGGTKAITYLDWFSICDSQMSKAELGVTLTTEVASSGGNRAVSDTQRKDQLALFQHDADCLAETIKRQLVYWMMRLNYPDLVDRFCPCVGISVEDDPDPSVIIDRAVKAAGINMPIDARKLAAMLDLPLADPDDETAIILRPIIPGASEWAPEPQPDPNADPNAVNDKEPTSQKRPSAKDKAS